MTEVRERVVTLYKTEQRSALSLSAELGIGKSTVLKILKAAGVSVRPLGQPKQMAPTCSAPMRGHGPGTSCRADSDKAVRENGIRAPCLD